MNDFWRTRVSIVMTMFWIIFIWVSCQFECCLTFILNLERIIISYHSSLSQISSKRHESLCFWRKSLILIHQKEREKWWAKSFDRSNRKRKILHARGSHCNKRWKWRNYLLWKSSDLYICSTKGEKLFGHVELIAVDVEIEKIIHCFTLENA